MSSKRKSNRPRRDYTEEFLIPDQDRDDEEKREYQGGIYSDSAVGGASQDQQNPWQGSQDQAKSEWP